jgi:2-methylisocitrate lyase-like PEP mutase family enzyme
VDRAERLRKFVDQRRGLPVPGAANPLFARIIEGLGFEAVYISGAAVANMQYGLPDLGLTTATEIVAATNAIYEATSIPLVVDGDTGYGNALNVYRTVRQLERAGASAIQLEDQTFPKKCGHFAGKDVISSAEMVEKIKAATDSRAHDSTLIIARTDAFAVEGLDRAIERANLYARAGADLTFVEAVTSVEDLRRVAREIPVPQVGNIVFGGKTPDPGGPAFEEMGFSFVLYANAALQAAVHATEVVLGSLKSERSLNMVSELLTSFENRQRIVAKGAWDELEERYRGRT